MKYIEKGAEPQEFTDWKNSQVPAPVWDSLSGKTKRILHNSLINEQGHVCCYCGDRITGDQDSHIEHFRPRYRFRDIELEYSNLLASCNGGEGSGISPGQVHCGHRKHNWFDDRLTVSPLEPNCEKHFKYLGNGEMTACDDPVMNDSASTTIEQLGLNSPSLIRRRKSAVDGLGKILSELRKRDEPNIQQLIEHYGSRDGEGRYTPFCAAIIYRLQWMQENP